MIWERLARTNAPHTKAFPSFRLLRTFPGLTALRRLAGDALSTRPRVWQCTERVSTAHVWCIQPRYTRTWGRAARRLPKARGPPGSGAAPRTAREPLATRPPFCSLLGQPHGARASPSGPPLQPWVSQPRPFFCPSLPEPKSPGCSAAGDPSASCRCRGARSHRSLPPRSGYRLMKCSFSSVICFVFLQSSDK